MINSTLPLANVELIKAEKARERKAAMEAREYRKENYYNCLDDFSYGGLCDWADQVGAMQLNSLVKLFEAQDASETKSLTETDVDLVLVRESDGKRFEKVVETRFGYSCVSKDGEFVGFAKKISTYHKKGLRTFEVTRKYEYQLGHAWTRSYKPVFTWIKAEDPIEREVKTFETYGNIYAYSNRQHSHVRWVWDLHLQGQF